MNCDFLYIFVQMHTHTHTLFKFGFLVCQVFSSVSQRYIYSCKHHQCWYKIHFQGVMLQHLTIRKPKFWLNEFDAKLILTTSYILSSSLYFTERFFFFLNFSILDKFKGILPLFRGIPKKYRKNGKFKWILSLCSWILYIKRVY